MPGRTARLTAAAAALLLAMVPTLAGAAKPPPPPPDYGPAPDWARYRELGEEAIRGQMIDPESARFRWPNGYDKSGYHPIFAARVYGYATCGYVNGRNRMGGYAGEKPFVMVIDHDRVLFSEIAHTDGDIIAQACKKANFSPASDMAEAAAQASPPRALGLTVSAVPDGAYVAGVAQDGAAQAAGMKAGLVITRVNGIETRGLPITTVQQVLGAARGTLNLETIDGHLYALALAGGAPPPKVEPGDEP